MLQIDGGGERTDLICGAVQFDHAAAAHLMKALPRILRIESAGSAQGEWVQSTLRYMATEARHLRIGGEAVITRLSDVLVIQAIRTWLEESAELERGWIGALRDEKIGRALTMIHRDPAREWSVASLADEVFMSRSAFAARFTELVGQPAMAYVTWWRMQVARGLIVADGLTAAEAAGRVGYNSEAAFSRAFKRTLGVSPGAARTGARTHPPCLDELAMPSDGRRAPAALAVLRPVGSTEPAIRSSRNDFGGGIPERSLWPGSPE